MTIKEVETAVNIDRANIRYYEKEGLLVTRRNPLNGYRDYSEENIEYLKKIVFLRNLEISIEDIRQLQNGKISLDDLMQKQEEELKRQFDKLKTAVRVCCDLQTKGYMTFDVLETSEYGESEIRGQREILADAFGELAGVKDILLPWMFVILSLLTAAISFPLLPETIPINWDGIYVSSEADRLVIFLFPLGMAFIAVFLKSMISNVLYRNMPFYLHYVDGITGYVSICLVILLFSYQAYSIAYVGGTRLYFGLIGLIELILFAVGFLVFILLPSITQSK